ncbi:fibronectin type III domain-containing protein [Bernardetia litoralis DSM 6794]|uniref:Fibronectin type III domain-containing protein n=1 Tax=Bernardetia litoralis (strain ATCC 23117 / DSM 6794 / NBRC 15988 / NCIMB 1366 / Fx l1 / Sio-4) TaxID=880071 RepID=I4AG19_BERLS|nr:M43 family zinc metalloprotease [Bernardetia litoralis]AFM02904.1 fibronectin type III domain-containing protein [Bernardetia litoralis DSM 6794]
MKRILLPLLGVIWFTFVTMSTGFAQQNGIIRCATMENDAELRANNPNLGTLDDMEQMLAPIIKDKQQVNPNAYVVDGVYIIPVVVHVIHDGEAIGVGNNISYALIESQIETLNDDFRRRTGTNGFNTHPDGADTKIEFRLAQRKPDGTAFTEIGVNRIDRNAQGWGALPYGTGFIDGTIKPYTTTTQGYDGSVYMSYWCVPISGGILGYAQFPQTTLSGMDCNAVDMVTDGVVMATSTVGGQTTPSSGSPYNLGRTATHEIGHWLGLRHIWGDGGCTVDDYCADTPTASAANYGCPTGTNSCTDSPVDDLDMVENYMDYTEDACMNIFTNDQKIRMRTILETTRFSLINSVASIPPNPSDAGVLNIITPIGDICSGTVTPSVRVKNYGSTVLTSVTIESRIGTTGAYTSQAFTGLNVAAGGTIDLVLNNITGVTFGTYTFEAKTILPNGVTDPYTPSDLSNSTFTLGDGSLPILADFEGADFPSTSWQLQNPGEDCNLWVADNSPTLIGADGNRTKAALVRHHSYTGTGQEDILISPSINLTTAGLTSAGIEFDLAYRQRNTSTSETLRIDVSTDCGATWIPTPIYSKTGTDLATVTTTSTAAFIPTVTNQWRRESVSLNAYIGQSIKVRFVTVNANGNNLWIDNIKIYDARPTIEFASITNTTTENSTSGTIDCRGYQDLDIPVSVTIAPSADVTTNISITSGTMNAQDYILQTPTLTFAAGSTASQNVVVRVFNDDALEIAEDLELTLSIVGTDAILGTNTVHTLTVNDNDDITQNVTQTLFSEDFEAYAAGAVSNGWTITTVGTANGSNNWVFGENGGMTGTRSAYITNNATTRNPSYTTSSTSRRRLVSPAISTVGATNLQLSFDFKVEGEGTTTIYDYGRLMYATSPTGTYTNITGPVDGTNNGTAANAAPFYGQSSATAYTVTLPAACQNQATLYLVWRWDNDGSVGTNPPFTVDNIVLTGDILQEYPVENTLTSKEVYLGANSTVYVISSNDKIMAKLENNTAHDYGCTTVAIDRIGTGQAAYTSTGAENGLTQKSFRITPTTISTEDIDVTLYYTNTEKIGWEAATGLSWTTDAKMHRTGGAISTITPTTPIANGTTNTDHALTTSTYLTTEHAAKASINNGLGNGNISSGFAIGNPSECGITAIAYVNQTACVDTNNKYTATITVTYTNPSGNLVVNGQTFTTTTSPQTITLTNLESDGNTVDVTASFSGNTACTMTSNALFTAPAACNIFTGTVTLGTITPTTYCAGTSISVPYTTSGTFGSINEFTAQLSDATGSFTTPTVTASGTSPISLAIPSGATAGTTYKVRVISTQPNATSAETTITINAAPNVTFTLPVSSLNRCSTGSAFALTGGLPAGGTYSGTGVTAGNFNPTTAGIGTHTITYSVTTGGCTSTATQDIVVSSPPTADYTNPPNICAVTTTATLTGGFPTGGVYSGTNVNSINGTFDAVAAGGAGTYILTYTVTIGSCTSSDTASVIVIDCPTGGGGGTTTPTVTTPTGFTATGVSTSQINLSWDAVSGATGYIIYIGNTVVTTINSGTTTTFEHTGLNADTRYSYRLVALNGSVRSQAVQANGNTFPNAPTVVSNTASCGTGSATIVLGGSGFIFNIYLDEIGGTPIAQTTNATYQTPVITQNTVYYISVMGIRGQESARTRVEAVVTPVIEATITEGSAIRNCDATTTLTANLVDSATYTWLINGVTIDNSNTNTFVVTRSGSYQVRITRGSCTAISAFSRVTLNYAPVAEISNGITTNFCENGVLRAREAANATYSWTFNNTVVGTDREVSVSQSGEYTLTVTEDGCSATDAIQVVVTSLPSVSVEASSATFCPDEEITLTTDQISGVTYDWSRNGRVIRRDAGNSITVTTGGDYSVAISQNGCSVSSAVINVERLSTLPAYLRTTETTLFVESESTISNVTWTIEGTDDASLEGQTTVTPIESAAYSALVTYENGCSIRTRTVQFNVPAPVVVGEDEEFIKALRIYPNPSTSGVFQIDLGQNIEKTTLILIDQLGRTLETVALPSNINSYQLDLSKYASALYTLQFKSEKGVITRKIVIEK